MGDTLPPYWGEILTPPALSYLQAKQSVARKQSPPWAVMPNKAVESPKTKCSSSKGRHHCSFRCGCNTSTPECPDSTSAKKPSSSKDLVLKEQDKSPWSCGSCKCGHSPSPSAKSDGCKQKEATQKTPTNSTPPSPSAPVGLMAFTVPQDPTVRQPSSILPPSPQPPWVLVPLDNGDLESRCSLSLLYTSPGFNLPEQPVTGLSNLTPSIPSLAGSHQVSSTWPASIFTPGPSSPHLTIDQANSLYKLATECQGLDIKLAKKFQVLSALEAIHHNSIQGMVHETPTLGCSARETAYFAIIWDGVPDDEHEATTHCLCSEANVTWKEMHEVMYNHQLHYDG